MEEDCVGGAVRLCQNPGDGWMSGVWWKNPNTGLRRNWDAAPNTPREPTKWLQNNNDPGSCHLKTVRMQGPDTSDQQGSSVVSFQKSKDAWSCHFKTMRIHGPVISEQPASQSASQPASQSAGQPANYPASQSACLPASTHSPRSPWEKLKKLKKLKNKSWIRIVNHIVFLTFILFSRP